MPRILNILSNHIDFHELVLLEKKTDKLYRSISNSFTGNFVYQKALPLKALSNNGQRPMVLTSVPSYINTKLDLGSDTVIKKVKTFPGSLIKLSVYESYEEYLKKNFAQKGRSHFIKSQNLLDECFTVRYKIYYGSIEEEEYQIIFNAFEQMQAKRFEERGMRYHTDPMLSEYRAKTLGLVRSKEACISVIYNGDRPIAISLNYILGKIVHGFTKTFDSAYSKFSLGNIELLNVIKWCFDEGFEVFDFMKGEYSYKSRFADTSYPFLIETIYSKKEALSRVWGHSVFFGLKLFYFVYHATKSIRSINTQKSTDSSKNNIKVQKTLLDSTTVGSDEKRVHFNEIQSQYIQRAICDYCYRRREQMDSLKFYKKRDRIKMVSQREVLIFQVNGPMDTKENRQ